MVAKVLAVIIGIVVAFVGLSVAATGALLLTFLPPAPVFLVGVLLLATGAIVFTGGVLIAWRL